MAALAIISLVLVLEPLVFGTTRLVRRWWRSARREYTGAPPPALAPELDSERRLVADLLAGRIDTAAYHAGMQTIAKADDLRSPLLVPGDGGRDVS